MARRCRMAVASLPRITNGRRKQGGTALVRVTYRATESTEKILIVRLRFCQRVRIVLSIGAVPCITPATGQVWVRGIHTFASRPEIEQPILQLPEKLDKHSDRKLLSDRFRHPGYLLLPNPCTAFSEASGKECLSIQRLARQQWVFSVPYQAADTATPCLEKPRLQFYCQNLQLAWSALTVRQKRGATDR